MPAQRKAPQHGATPSLADGAVSLAARIRAGEPQAFETVFRAYRAALTRLATRYAPSPAVAEEIVQDVFLKIWRTRATWDPGANMTAYLFAVTRNAAMNVARRGHLEARWLVPLAGDDEGAPSAPAPDTVFEARDRQQALALATGSLSARCREAFLLRWRDGLSYAEIAHVMGVSIKTVEKQLGVALKVLRRALRPWIPGEP